MKNRNRKFSIDLDVWGAVIHVVVSDSRDEAVSCYHKKIDEHVQFKGSPSNGCVGSVLIEDSNKSVVLWLSHRAGTRALVHESIHAAFHILESSGVPVTSENQEALCYLSDFIVGKISEKLWGKKKPKKNFGSKKNSKGPGK